jgi:D-alanyl-D-alanine carboxypeptidase (penicillin-binding protein 5/6)
MDFRMLKKKLTALTSLILVFLITVSVFTTPEQVNAAFKSEYEPTCDAIYMMNMDTGVAVYEKNSDKIKLPASLTKMMTCIVAYERADSLDEMVVVDSRAVRFVNYNTEGVSGVWTNIQVNERFSLKDLIYEALVASENCAAEAIGYYISKQYYGSDSNQEFIDFMNDRAVELGCTNTKFKCASGLTTDIENHHSTAHDMALIANYLMSIPDLAEIAYTPHSYGIKPTNKHDEVQLVVSTNLLIREGEKADDGTDYFYQYCEGVKTGYLEKSGHCFAGYATKSGYKYICVLLDDGAPTSKDKNMAFVDAKNLFEWAFNNLYLAEIYNTSEPIAEIPLNLAWNKDTIVLVPQDDFSTLLPTGITATSVSKKITLNESVNAPVRKGQVLGTAELSYDGEVIGTINLVANESVERSNLLYALSLINALFSSKIFIVILVLCIIAAAVYIMYSYTRKQRINNLKRTVSRRGGGRRHYR